METWEIKVDKMFKQKLCGKIIVNPFKCPGESIKQANRLLQEFELRGVNASIIDNGYAYNLLCNDKLYLDFKNTDFVVFLDKDKYLAEIIQKQGIAMFNDAKGIAVCDDKGLTCISLANSGLHLPKTIFAPVCYSQQSPLQNEFVERVESVLGYPLVVKSSYGSMGKGIHLVKNRAQLVEVMNSLKTYPHIFQEYLGKQVGTDIRVIVIGGKAVALMKRINKGDFRSNIGQGGYGEGISLTDENYKQFIDCAEQASKILNLHYCGVDLLFADDNSPVICEVNSNAFFEGIEIATKVNVAGAYADYIIKTIS